MDVYDAIYQRRSVRRFKQTPVSVDVLKKIVDAARVAPSAKNLQPFEYLVVTDDSLRKQVFGTIGWAGYLQPAWAPPTNERPSAYIVMLVCKDLAQYAKWDSGLAAENMMLAAESEGLGSVMLLKVNRSKLRDIFALPKEVEIDAVIALGYKAEQPVLEDFHGFVEYWKDDDGVMHVPKRSLNSIFHLNTY